MSHNFKHGDRVRYTGKSRYYSEPWRVGMEGVIDNTERGVPDSTIYAWVRYDKLRDGRTERCSHYPANVELVEPDTPFQASLRAYIASEKKELGLV